MEKVMLMFATLVCFSSFISARESLASQRDFVIRGEGEDNIVTVSATQKAGSHEYENASFLGGIKLNFQMSGITKIELESVDGNALAGKAKIIDDAQGNPVIEDIEDPKSIISFSAADGSDLTPGKDYIIYTLPCDVYGGYKLTFFKDGLEAQYFGVHQKIREGSFIVPDDFNEKDLEFKEHGAPLVEEGRPELDEETKRLISNYRSNPSEKNLQALMNRMEIRYDKVVARKKAKLRQLEREAKTFGVVENMREIVSEMVENRDMRLQQQFQRFADTRRDNDMNDDWMLLRGIPAENAYIGRTPVTNAGYALFDKDFSYDKDKKNFPVVNITIEEATAYCNWLSSKDSKHEYRLPTDEEWVLAAGHMAKDVSMNSNHVESGLTRVDAYKQTTGACGGIDFWGNCWEWTTSVDANGLNIIKGGSWDSSRDDCRSEKSDVSRDGSQGYDNVGFRVVRVDR